jgi:DNA modification methylase
MQISKEQYNKLPDHLKEYFRTGNIHPTLKPVKLMQYLIKLVTPTNGTCLDPFMGSGSTGKAAKMEGFNFIGIEREEEYFNIAKARIDGTKKDKQLNLF